MPTFGIFDHIEGIPGTPTPQLLKERSTSCGWPTRPASPGTTWRSTTAPICAWRPTQEMFIAAASQVTDTIRMGPMVKLLPLHHPVRIVEDMCVVDNLTNGRLEFGVGRGVGAGRALLVRQQLAELHGTLRGRARDHLPCAAKRRDQRRGLEVLLLPHDADGDAAGPAAHPVLVSGQSGDRGPVRTQPDVAGADRRRVVRACTSTPGTRTERRDPSRRARTPSHASGCTMLLAIAETETKALEVAERGDEGPDAAHARRSPLGRRDARVRRPPMPRSDRCATSSLTSTTRSGPAPARPEADPRSLRRDPRRGSHRLHRAPDPGRRHDVRRGQAHDGRVLQRRQAQARGGGVRQTGVSTSSAVRDAGAEPAPVRD